VSRIVGTRNRTPNPVTPASPPPVGLPVSGGTSTPTTTFEGGAAVTRSPERDLYLLCASFMFGEPTFYETVDDRVSRFRGLVSQVVAERPEFIPAFVPYLRDTLNMRTVSVVLAAEYALAVRALREADRPVGTATSVRRVVASALSRADEPAEFVAYWAQRTGRKTLPGGVQRGVADAVTRLYTEYSALKYDGASREWRMGDVLDLTHPTPSGTMQGALFPYLLDRRHGRADTHADLSLLPMVAKNRELHAMPTAEARAALLSTPGLMDEAGITWEQLSGFGPMDKDAWEAAIPTMGYMALLRNLRNFDEKGVSDAVADKVAARLADPEQVAKSRQFPYRFLSAHRAAPSLRWGWPLERALDAACAGIPSLPGRTLVIIDTSGSMQAGVSGRSKVSCVDAAAVLAIALAKRGADVDVVGFADTAFEHKLTPGKSVLSEIERFSKRVGSVGYGTNIPGALDTYSGHDRVFLFSDMQTMDGHYDRGAVHRLPAHVPYYGFNLAGYGSTVIDATRPNRYEFGGFSDSVFRLIPALESGADQVLGMPGA